MQRVPDELVHGTLTGYTNRKCRCDACTEANRKYQHENYLRNKARHNEQSKQWYKDNPDKAAEIRAKYRKKIKDQVFDHYGWQCACCGESEPLFLAIDHINGGGNKHRKEIGRGNMKRWLIQNNFPDGFQTLCHNCNQGRELNGGVCPHEGVVWGESAMDC